MNILASRRSMRGLIVASFAALAGCVVGGGYDGDVGVGVGYGVGFYEPGGYDYGGWGPGYAVGPPRRGFDRGRPDSHPAPHPAPHPAYRPAPTSRPMPSLPSHPRGR
jgi:hypothetical protein